MVRWEIFASRLASSSPAFFRVLRDRHEELIRAIALTPFSREEYHRAIYGVTHGLSEVERARRFYIKARQTRTALAQTASLGRWANCKDTSRAGMSGVVSRWLGGVDALDDIAAATLGRPGGIGILKTVSPCPSRAKKMKLTHYRKAAHRQLLASPSIRASPRPPHIRSRRTARWSFAE